MDSSGPNGKIRDYRDLNVWKDSMDIAVKVHALTGMFPREELFGMTSQMRRCATSIPSDIAEGFGRSQRRSFVQFLRIAQGSLKELETQSILARRIGLMAAQQAFDLEARYQQLGKMLVAVIRSLDRPDKT